MTIVEKDIFPTWVSSVLEYKTKKKNKQTKKTTIKNTENKMQLSFSFFLLSVLKYANVSTFQVSLYGRDREMY